jgi:uncharacterized membrane protein YbhN (UPF0104 family)
MRATHSPAKPVSTSPTPLVNCGSRRRRWVWCAAWGIATACVFAFVRALDWRTTLARLAHADPGWIAVAVLGHFVTLPSLAEQWFRLLPPGTRMGRRALWESVTIGMAAMNTLPFGGGHALTVGLLIARGATVEGAVSLLALEQLCDGVAKLALLMVALAVAPLPAIWQRTAWIMAAALLAGFLILLGLARHPGETRWLRRWRVKWTHPLQAVRRPGVLLIAVALSLLGKAGGLLAVYAVHRSLGMNLPLSSTPVVLAAVTFATLMALSPGSIGVFEMAAIAAYRLMGVPIEEAGVLALVQHACFLLPNIGTGYAVMLWRTITTK